MSRLENKVSIITGGASGIGEAISKIFHQEGSNICVIDNNKNKLENFEKSIDSKDDVLTFSFDVSDENSWKDCIKEVLNTWGKIDVLVNNAGMSLRSNFEEMKKEDWDKVFAVNSTAVMLGTQNVIANMKKNRSGSIINVSSIFGLVGSARSSTAYHASKGSSRIFTKTIAAQYGKHNIRSNSIHPGFTDTPMTEDIHSIEQVRNERLAMTPMGRLGKPEDIAYGALYLASDESSWVTGSELVIDGGETCW
ncbi:MAG: SDR family oxidoreductase [Chloroflexota bacterium]|nr:SDR family oxidoreductase [Chloroflexota bacterium]